MIYKLKGAYLLYNTGAITGVQYLTCRNKAMAGYQKLVHGCGMI